ncbi:protein PHOSPHATE STARVATION RESPONSE 1-like [Zingiber officinale]|uniref:protein PHOSPHATE STARVATION RESPONSE 1-like n=1 Tax=Zingiber officinale TaxID=94328 RepID=UPI001C4C4BD7|nr:protein PHOSPHATE STARVATION RESPONSE 1-like [Zingiber officinale]
MSYNQFQNNGFTMPSRENLCPVAATHPLGTSKQNPNFRIKWTPSLHWIFVVAVERLGGATEAKPTAIVQAMETMGVFGLTLQQVKSHLQKYRNQSKYEKREQHKHGSESDETLSTFLVPSPDIRDHEVHACKTSLTEVGRQILEEIEVEDFMLQLNGTPQDTYMESLVEDPYDKAIREFLNA